MKRIVFSLFLLLMVTGVNAQKIDTRLTELVKRSATVYSTRANAASAANLEAYQKKVKENYIVDFNTDDSVRTLGVTAYLKKGAECPTAQLEASGITVRSTFDNVAFLAVPADMLSALEAIDDIILAVPESKVKVMNMEARTATKADKAGTPADATAAGLPQAYTGKGVVLGIIDAGIDFNHVAFRNADGSTRVQKAMVYGDGISTSDKEYTAATIAGATTDGTDDSHGSHTSAIAGGSVVTDGEWKWQGVAPEARLFQNSNSTLRIDRKI